MKTCSRYNILTMPHHALGMCVRGLGLLCLTGTLAAAEPGQALTAEEQEFVDGAMTAPMIMPPNANSNASRQADPELLRMAAQEPEKFVGKMLSYDNGNLIGRILNVRRRVDDRNHYLIIDATEYFNSDTEFAVPMNDVARMNDDSVIVLEAEGMHLRGMEYYADDYVEAGEPILD